MPSYHKVEFPLWYFIHYRTDKEHQEWAPYSRDNGTQYFICRKEVCDYWARRKIFLNTHLRRCHGENLWGDIPRSALAQHKSRFISRDESRPPSQTLTQMRSWRNTDVMKNTEGGEETDDCPWEIPSDQYKKLEAEVERLEEKLESEKAKCFKLEKDLKRSEQSLNREDDETNGYRAESGIRKSKTVV